MKRGIRQELLDQVEQRGGRLTRSELLRLRVRYFADGWVIGSRAFVDEQFERMRSRFGAKREDGARRMRGGDWGELCALRDLRVAVFG